MNLTMIVNVEMPGLREQEKFFYVRLTRIDNSFSANLSGDAQDNFVGPLEEMAKKIAIVIS